MERITKLSGKMVRFANVITSAISLILQLQAMEVDLRSEPEPLVRTHYTSNGNNGTITMKLYTDPKNRPNGNELESCLSSYFLNALGVSFSFPSEANIPGAEIVIEGGKGIPDLVLINESRMRFFTGTDGQVTFNVIGRAQKITIPDSAQPVNKEFSIIVSAQPEEAGLGSMANIFFGGLGGLSGAAAFLSSLIDVLKTFTYDMGEKVLRLTDWAAPGWKVESWNNVSLPGYGVKWTGGLNCGSPYGPWEFKAEGIETSQGATILQTFKIPFSVDGNTTATQTEHLTLAMGGLVGDYTGAPKVTITQIPEGYRMEFASFHMTGSTCVMNGPCQDYDAFKKGWSTNIVPADPGQCP